MMPNQLKKMKTESLQSSENLSESLKTEINIPNLSTGSMQSSEKSTKLMPNQLKKMKTESLQSSENLSESLKTEMNIPNLSTGSMQSSENINQMAKVFILPNSNL